MRRSPLVVLMVLSTAVGGCATWARPETSQAQLDRDEAECKAMSRGSSRGPSEGLVAIGPLIDDYLLYKQCMRGRGYVER